jgi:hypothetical protein
MTCMHIASLRNVVSSMLVVGAVASAASAQFNLISATRELKTNASGTVWDSAAGNWTTGQDPRTVTSNAMGEWNQQLTSHVPGGLSTGTGFASQHTYLTSSSMHGVLSTDTIVDSFGMTSPGTASATASLVVNFEITQSGDYSVNAFVRSFDVRDGGIVSFWNALIYLKIFNSNNDLVSMVQASDPGDDEDLASVIYIFSGQYRLEVSAHTDIYTDRSEAHIASEAIFDFKAVPAPAAMGLALGGAFAGLRRRR